MLLNKFSDGNSNLYEFITSKSDHFLLTLNICFFLHFFHGISTIQQTKKNRLTKVWLWRRPGEGSSTSYFQNGAPVFCTKSYCWLWTSFPDAHRCVWRTDRSTSRYVGTRTSVFLDPNIPSRTQSNQQVKVEQIEISDPKICNVSRHPGGNWNPGWGGEPKAKNVYRTGCSPGR